MWDDPQALRKLSGTLFGIALVLALFGAVHVVVHLPLFALRTAQLTSVPQRVDADQVEAMLRNELHGNFFTVDLAQVRHDLEQLPWVRKAIVRRHFPWQLDVELEEHVALAHWNDAQLVDTHGEVFDGETTQDLPALSGPQEMAAEVVKRYGRFGEMLAPLQQHIAQLSLSPRGAWRLKLQDGMVLELGREQMEQRLTRFVSVYPYSLAALRQPAGYVDLRYRNGFAAYLPTAHGRG